MARKGKRRKGSGSAEQVKNGSPRARRKDQTKPEPGSFGDKLQSAIAEAKTEGDPKPPSAPARENKVRRPGRIEEIAEFEGFQVQVSPPGSVGESLPASKEQAPTGAYLQAPRSRGGDERELVIGLDFGTSSTKVAVRDPAIRQSYLVDFGSRSPFGDQSYLFPTRLYYRQTAGKFSITEGDREFSQLKVKLMREPNDPYVTFADGTKLTAVHLVAAYLGILLKLVRKNFLDDYGDQYARASIDWALNVGMPSRSYDDAEKVNRYRLIAQAAWTISVASGLPSVGDVENAISEASRLIQPGADTNSASIHPDLIAPVPEVVAGIIGYARSPARQLNQMHLLVDIGASTVDVCNVVLFEGSGDRYSFLTAEVEPLGGFYLIRKRLNAFASKLEAHIKSLSDSCSTVSPPPTVGEISLSIDEDEVDREFISLFASLVEKSLLEVKTAGRYPRIGSQSHIPVLLTGGGSRIRQYVETIERVSNNITTRGLPELEIVPFETFDELVFSGKNLDLSRVGVAYGLSFGIDDLGDIKAPNEVPSIREEKQTEAWWRKGGFAGASWRHDR